MTPALIPREMSVQSIEALAESWARQLVRAKSQSVAADLYVGRSVADAKLVANLCPGELMIVSAGLGLIVGKTIVPNYQLTVVDGVGSIRPWLIRNNYQSGQWWSALNSALGNVAPISARISEARPNDLFLIALPSTYIELISNDFSQVQPEKAANVRIFTSTAGVNLLPKHLTQCAMPYDDRLEGIGGYSGTRSDFPQRAMRHFVERLQAHGLGAADGAHAVRMAMASSRGKQIPRRTRLDDGEISKLIAANWTATGGSASRLLRVLRDDNLVACEQSRFSSLWRQVRDKVSIEEHHG